MDAFTASEPGTMYEHTSMHYHDVYEYRYRYRNDSLGHTVLSCRCCTGICTRVFWLFFVAQYSCFLLNVPL